MRKTSMIFLTIIGWMILGASPSVCLAQTEAEKGQRPIGVFTCPREISAFPSDVAFGAYIQTQRFNSTAATVLGIESHADRKMLLVGAPGARVGEDEQVGCVAIIDAETKECVKVLTPPYPMDYWRNGKNDPRFSGMHFGKNFCVSPGGKWLFVGCGVGGKGFVLNLEDGVWFEVTDPLMQVTADNKTFLNYGSKGEFADDKTLYLVSNTQTGGTPSSVPGILFYEVILDSNRGVVSMKDPKYTPSSDPEVERANIARRGHITNRANHRNTFGFQRHPAMDSFNGRLASNAGSFGNSGPITGACAAEKYDFYTEISVEAAPSPRDERPFPSGTWGLPFIERCVPKVDRKGETSDSIAGRDDSINNLYGERLRFFPFHEDRSGRVQEKPGEWSLTDIGLVDRYQNIGWVTGTLTLEESNTGIFGLFRWCDERHPTFVSVPLSFGNESQAVWGDPDSWSIYYDQEGKKEGSFFGFYSYHVGVCYDGRLAEGKPFLFQFLDPEDGMFYVGVVGARRLDKGVVDPGLIYCFDVSQPLEELGWKPEGELWTMPQGSSPAPAGAGGTRETFVEVTDTRGTTIKARLASPPEDNSKKIKVVRDDGKVFELGKGRITPSSLEALLTTTRQLEGGASSAAGGKPLEESNVTATPGRQAAPQIGDVINFKTKTERGRSISSEKYRGEVLLLSFWAPWCAPCVDEIEELKEVYDRFSSRGFEIVGVPWTNNRETLSEFLITHDISWPQCLADEGETSLLDQFGISGIPTGILIDTEGKLVKRILWAEELPGILEEILPK